MTKAFVILGAAMAIALPIELSAQRRALSVTPITVLAHRPTTVRYRFDTVGRTYSRYSVEGTIVFEPASEKFLLSWNGVDGRRQTLWYEPRYKIVPVIVATVSFDAQTRLYTYSYEVENSVSALQKLQTVYVEAAPPERATAPQGWYSRKMTPFLQAQFAVTSGWAWSDTESARGGVPPGQRISGFQLVSDRPPAIVRCYAAGFTPVLEAKEDLPEELHEAVDKAAWILPTGVTIGPSLAPPSETPRDAVERLSGFMAEAERQGWFGTAVLAREARRALESIRNAVVAGESVRVSEQVTSMLARISGPEYAGLLSEGRALLEGGLRQLGGQRE